jgi:hypothetical protein
MDQEMLNHIGEITERVNALEKNLYQTVKPRLKPARLEAITPLGLFDEIRLHLGELLEMAREASPCAGCQSAALTEVHCETHGTVDAANPPCNKLVAPRTEGPAIGAMPEEDRDENILL